MYVLSTTYDVNVYVAFYCCRCEDCANFNYFIYCWVVQSTALYHSIRSSCVCSITVLWELYLEIYMFVIGQEGYEKL